ncbi:MAG: TIGR00159 family protein [Elusimicrobia bacterium]|nr:TIGR00159 family protein [Elusimicrobiota bacterium]
MYWDYFIKTLDLLLVYYIVFRLILIIKGTKAMQVVWGIFILILITFSAKALQFNATFWLLQQFWFAGVFLLIVVFQQEIRNALANLGTNPLARVFVPQEYIFIPELISAIKEGSSSKTGMLIALELDMGLREFTESGIKINGEVSKDLLLTIFKDGTPLHDGGVVISANRIVAAACQFPLTEQKDLSRIFGMRHRSAIGLSELTDAIVLIVSEETGIVSMARNGKIMQHVDMGELEKTLFEIFKGKFEKSLMRRSQRK